MSNRGSIRTAKTNIIVLVVLAALLISGGIWIYYRGAGGSAAAQNKLTLENLNLAVSAVSAAEDLEFDRAVNLWKDLQQVVPNDPNIQLNRAVTVLKWIEKTNGDLSSGKVRDPAKIQELKSELEVAYERANELIKSINSLSSDSGRAVILTAALIESQARKATPTDLGLLRESADILAESLDKNPAQPMVAAKFDELMLELSADASDLDELRVEALLASSQAEPRNLFLLDRAANLLMEAEDPRLELLLDRCVEITRPMWSLIAKRTLDRINPPELIKTVRTAIEEGDWATVRGRRGLKGWLNMFKQMSFRDDRRLIMPDLMAMLDTEFLQQIADRVPNVPAAQVELPVVNSHRLIEAQTLAWYDLEVDLRFELAVGNEKVLSILSLTDAGEYEVKQKVEVDKAFEGILVADLRLVADPSRIRSPASVADLMKSQAVESSAGEQDDASIGVYGRRHDTFQELVLWGKAGITLVTGVAKDDGFELEVSDTELAFSSLTDVTSASAMDFEADGDLDLVFATKAGIHLYRNNGDRSFLELTEFSQLEDLPGALQNLTALDIDGDLDQDILALSPESEQVVVLENILHGQFRLMDVPEGWPVLEGPKQLVIEDLDGNLAWDLCLLDSNGLTCTFSRKQLTSGVLFQKQIDCNGASIEVMDLNNDGFLDIAVSGEDGVDIYPGSSEAWEQSSPGPQKIALEGKQVGSLSAIDFNGNGAQDLACIEEGFATVLITQPTPEAGYLSVRVRGRNDENGGGRNNHFAIGSTLEIWANGRQQKRLVSKPVVHFGVGNASVENLRVVLTNGLTQNIEQPGSNLLVEEIQELKGSCPFVYGWNGERFELITDLLWNAPLGLQVSPGEVVPDRRWEYLLLPGEKVRPQGNQYKLRITEELWEVAYFDHVQLTAIDHPKNVRVFTNEKVGPPFLAEPRVFAVSETHYPRTAIDSRGRNVLDLLSRADGEFVQSFEKLVCQGLVEPHFVELDFNSLDFEEDISDGFLFLTGWMHPTDTSLNIAISQNRERVHPEAPSLWVLDENDQWVCTAPVIGFPGGKTKSIVVPLKDVFLTDNRTLRIGSTQQLYWDEAFIGFDDQTVQWRQKALNCTGAELRYRGFGKLLERQSYEPHRYDYQVVSQNAKWPPLDGPFTRFGDVQGLLAEDDDRMVVMTSGDEIALTFDVPNGELPNGWTRDFVLHSVGWDKDADLNTIAGQSALPLPFKGQTHYPAPVDQWSEAENVWELNKAQLSRDN